MRNFYEHQEVAKDNSSRLVVMMCGAIAGTVLVTGLIVTASMFGTWYYLYLSRTPSWHRYPGRSSQRPAYREVKTSDFPWGLALFWYGTITGASGAAVGAVTYGKVKALRRGGGAAVAEALEGVRLGDPEARFDPYRGDPDCVRALNVVEELAIAARLPTPKLFLLAGQQGINAFAVGYTTDEAVIGLTEGTVRKLTREQLQGVVAHEFAHISNGDMRLNLQMIGYLHGLLGITVAATWMMSLGSELAYYGRRSDLLFGGLLFATGVLLWPVGLIGNLFASLIKAAFSRQREFLADAYAVEFTRNPEGVAGALKRIAGHARGSLVHHSQAVECSHLFFANGSRRLVNLFRSHPPLHERILRVDPHWDGRALFDEQEDLGDVGAAYEGTMNFIGHAPHEAEPPAAADEPEIPNSHMETFDAADRAAEEHRRTVQAAIPPVLWELSQEVPGAIVQLLALWFSAARPGEEDPERLEKLRPSLREPVTALVGVLRELDADARLLLLDTALQTLRTVDAHAFQGFVDDCQQLGLESGVNNGFRWAWHHLVQNLIRKQAEQARRPRYGSVEPVLGPCEIVLSALAHAGARGPMAAFALQRASTRLGHELSLRDPQHCAWETLDLALEQLAELSPRCRRDVLLACGSAVSCDQDVGEEEACLLRGIFSALDYPHARVLPGQPVAPGA